jgi:hypothetical protein
MYVKLLPLLPCFLFVKNKRKPPNPVSAVVCLFAPNSQNPTTAHNPPPPFVFFSSFALTKPKEEEEEEEEEEEILLHLHNRKKGRGNKKTINRECDDTKRSIITNLGKCFV